MRKISLIPYKCGDQDYNVSSSMVNVMFTPELHLGVRDLIENDRIARKIEAAKDNEVFLEEAEYSRLKQAVEAFTGYDRNSVEFISRIMGAEEITVKEVK